MAILFINKVPGDKDAYEKKAREIAYKLGIDVNWLQFLIDFESAGTFRASIENTYGCVGLIQFCPDVSGGSYKTIGGKKVYLSDLKAMTSEKQLDYVYEYLRPYKGDMQSYYDLYLAILWPAALGKPDEYVINTSSNPIFDLNKNGVITLGEVKQFLDNRVTQLVPSEYQDSFKKKSSFLRIYQREITIVIVLIGLLVILYVAYKKIT